MFRYYLRILRDAAHLLWSSAIWVEETIAAIFFLILMFNEPLGKKMLSWEVGRIDATWALLPIGLLFLYALLRANYAQFATIEQARDQLKARVDQRTIRQRVLKRLAERKTALVNLRTKRPDESELESWLEEMGSIVLGAIEDMKLISGPAAESFKTIASVKAADAGGINERHNTAILWLIIYSKRIDNFIEQHSNV